MDDLSWVMFTRGIMVTLHLGIVATALGILLLFYGLIVNSYIEK